jgi:GDPmannose 4,6-dehydratase
MKRAIIVGCNGQDGRILFEQLQARDYALIGIARDGTRLVNAQGPHHVDILEPADVDSLVRQFQPEHVYYLAAVHHSAQESIRLDARQLFEASYQVHVRGLVNFLQSMSTRCPQGRLFYAASSHVFGDPAQKPQNEQTPLNPTCIYGMTKTAGIHACRYYRRSQALHATVGILYNHESSYRRPAFVTQKIVRTAMRVSQGFGGKLVVGDLAAMVDWGWAADYVKAIIQMLDLPYADDIVVATGAPHSVQDFVEEAFTQLGLRWQEHVEEDPTLVPRGHRDLVGDSSKLRMLTGWRPSISFGEMVSTLLQGAREHLVKGIL